MSVYRRGGIYHIELRKRGYRRLRISSGSRGKATALDMQEALKWLMDRGRRDLLGLVLEGKLQLHDLLHSYQSDRTNLDHLLETAGDATLGDLVDEWVEWMRSPAAISLKTGDRFAPNTIHRYAASWAALFAVLAGGRSTKLSDLTSGAIADYRVRRTEDGCAIGTLNRDLVAVSSFLHWCAEEKQLSVPSLALRRQREPKGRERWLDPAELVAVREACPSDWWPLFATLLYTGMRVGEAQGLRWGDVNLSLHRISIHNRLRRLKTDPSNRDVPIAVPLSTLLKDMACSGTTRADSVFPLPYGDYDAAYRVWRRLCLSAGLHDGGEHPRPNATIHDLRHTFGVHAALAGVPVTSLQALLGHATAVMTLRYMKYAAESVRQQADVARVVGSMQGELGETARAREGARLLPGAHTSAHSAGGLEAISLVQG